MSDNDSSPDLAPNDAPMLLAQADTGPQTTGGTANVQAVDAAKVAQDAFNEALSSGKSAQDAVADAVAQVKQDALSRGLTPQQADALALQAREELGARLSSLPGIQPPAGVSPPQADAQPGTAPAGSADPQAQPSASSAAQTPSASPAAQPAPGPAAGVRA